MNIVNGQEPGPNNEEPTLTAPPMLVLEEDYEAAFLGNDVSVMHLPRAVYSLPLLLLADSLLHDGGEEQAQKNVAVMVQQVTSLHGDAAPIFLDDSITRERREAPKIHMP